MYRYFIGKYACEMKFGGMIGFIVGEIETPIVVLIDKIYSVYNNNLVGKLTKEKIIKNSISGNHNTFDSIHLRQNIKTRGRVLVASYINGFHILWKVVPTKQRRFRNTALFYFVNT